MSTPSTWKVRNGAFIGFVLVDMPKQQTRTGGLGTREDGWLPYCCDLRSVNEMKQRGHEGDEVNQTCFYHNGTLIGVVNAPITELVEYWLSVQNVFDRNAPRKLPFGQVPVHNFHRPEA